MARKKTVRRDPNVQTTADLPVWLATKLTAQRQAWELNQLRSCTHDPRPRQMPVNMCAWLPELVVCERCTHLLTVPLTHTQSNCCDCCDRVTPGTPEDHVIGGRMKIGGITYWFTLCGACHRAM